MTDLVHAPPERFFADRFDVTPGLIDRLIGSALKGRVDDADIYLEYCVNEELLLEEGKVKKASRHVSQGAGVRAQAGARTGYAHTDDISLPNLEEAARQARAIASQSSASAIVAVPSGRPPHPSTPPHPPHLTDPARQLDLLASVGHGLEGGVNRKGVSAFAGRMGQKVASELVTVVDDGTIPNRRGSLNVDDEGTPTGRTVLIDRGVLCGYMQDKLNARLMGMRATGNGRRESYASPPMPRMTNTFMLAGEDDPEDIIRSVTYGLYAVAFGGGQVDITSGKFVFSASEAYLVEDGRITAPVKGATLIGNGPQALTRVGRVGHDLQLDEGIGTCGKDGQSVPVGVGLPTIRIDSLTVGGTEV